MKTAPLFRAFAAFALLLASALYLPAHAQLRVEVSGVGESQIPIAIAEGLLTVMIYDQLTKRQLIPARGH